MHISKAANTDNNSPEISGIGQHLLADLYGVETGLLQDGATLVASLLQALQDAGFHVVRHCWHQFPGDAAGVTAVVLLRESHAAIHTYPEYGYLGLDIFSCGRPDPNDVLQAIRVKLKPQSVETSSHARGAACHARTLQAKKKSPRRTQRNAAERDGRTNR